MPHSREVGPSCSACSKGYVGRGVVAEVLTLDDDLRSLIHQGKPAAALQARAQEKGFLTMLDNGRELVERGITNAAEVERVVSPLDVVRTDQAAPV
ncbi:MAG: hypothetical protein A2341_04450 [Deltaproteobacteria bacterium RIFOXYB12_FULL_58_9]|nr:MAG: hypothetical protein A2341_04450 [Deltaproteobacteria bacterium RIFOXYB12_FULL_58_9]